MATTFQDNVWFETSEITLQDDFLHSTLQTTESSGTLPFPAEMFAILDLLIIAVAIGTFAAIIILLFIMYKHRKNKREPSNNVEIIRLQYKSGDEVEMRRHQDSSGEEIEITRQQHSSDKEDELTRQQQSSGKEVGEATRQQTSNGNAQEFYLELENPQEFYLELENPQEFYLELEGDDEATNTENIYANQQQPIYGNELGSECRQNCVREAQESTVLYENARSWKSRGYQTGKTDIYLNEESQDDMDRNIPLGNEATYQNVSSVG